MIHQVEESDEFAITVERDVEWPRDYEKSATGPTLAYYRRDNDHGIAAIDWVWMLEFAEKIFEKK